MSSNTNRAFWNASSASYQREHGRVLTEQAMAWGVWRIPESTLRVLDPIEGRDVLELGCGAAQWTAALMRAGARATGLDVSEQQLAHASPSAAAVPLVQGDAERLPFRTASFDIVFCDHGATVFASPPPTMAEVARVLRSGGLFAFCMSTPLRDICFDAAAGGVTRGLATDYFGLTSLDDGLSVEYQLPYGDWIRLFRRHHLEVEDLIELQPPPDAATTFADYVPLEWARRWPAEHIWKLRKRAR